MPAQVILFLQNGQIHCEKPGRNGSREKIDLPNDFAMQMTVIMNTLHDEDRRQQMQAEQVAEYNRKADAERIARSAQQERQSAQEIENQRRARWQAEYDNATKERQAEMLAIKEAGDRKRREYEEQLGKKLWVDVGTDHGISLANRVVSDKKRRPNKRFTMPDGTTYNPRSDKRYDANGKRIREPGSRFTKRDTGKGQVIDIKL